MKMWIWEKGVRGKKTEWGNWGFTDPCWVRGLVREKEQAEQQEDREKLKNTLAIWETGKIQQTKPKQKVEKKWKS